MSLNEDQEILEDFLIEAGEILEKLSEELVDLENQPDDKELLLSIFRGFHTLKGGASFLGFEPIVELSHKTEDVIDAIRHQKLRPNSDVMDVVLLSLDTLQDMRDSVAAGKSLAVNDPELLNELQHLAAQAKSLSGTTKKHVIDPNLAVTLNRLNEFKASLENSGRLNIANEHSEEFDDGDFEALLDEIHGTGVAPGSGAEPQVSKAEDSASEEVDIEELLDEFYGVGQVPGQDVKAKAVPMIPESGAERPDLQTMDDQDFEELLNHIVTEKIQVKQKQLAAESKFKNRRGAHKPTEVTTQSNLANSEHSIRVDVKRLDEIIDMVGELVLVRNRLATVSESFHDEALDTTSQNLDSVTRNLQSATMKTRLQPVRRVFSRFPRFIRDLARNMNKNVSLTLSGEDTELDKNVVEALAEPLIHMVRNAVDHGIEPPHVRDEMGKPKRGEVTLSARQEGEHFILTVADDGAGINVETLKQQALKKSIIDNQQFQSMSNEDALQLIFIPGSTTSAEVTEVSGRGVGMDAVRNKVQQLNGKILVDSTLHVGTRIEIKLPVSLAIFTALMVKVARQTYAIPITQMREVIKVLPNLISTATNKQLLFEYEGSQIPLISLHEWQDEEADSSSTLKEPYVIIYELERKPIALLIDKVLGQEDVVIKSLGKSVAHSQGITGATLTAEGSIALVLDIPDLVRHFSGLR